QLLCLGLGTRRIAAGIRRDEFDLTPRKRVGLLLEQRQDALLHLDPALGKRPGLDRQQSDLERSLGMYIGRPQSRHADASGGEAFQHLSTMDSHSSSSFWSPCKGS